ncbi:hypothetical protein BJ875DRAFT_428382 [Amylocarpus encephaloides]|uniref:Uncharacterized protein n=1 Tax=Amylocarpus encephaloides TaxID=45428 RepID=A0A9P7YFM5_9HELO|nr:hypothetical protein BJ875DRAFT_428382 [Amylocarpus encephaloides]
MGFLLLRWIPTIGPVATVAIFVFLGQYLLNVLFRTSWSTNSGSLVSNSHAIGKHAKKTSRKCEVQNRDSDEDDNEELKALKHLYYQLHSLEKFPEVLPKAKRLLLCLFMETSPTAHALPEHESILSVQSFSRAELVEFLHRRDYNIGKDWEQYNLRRKEGGPLELFEDREEATWWLKQIAPVKYVDGAWLGHIGKATAPFALLKTMKGAWQILSEELGDGDLGKNHVHLYHKLLETIAPGLPTADSLDFGHPRHQLNNLSVWKSALAQLLVSIFPSDFLPEILGFNLHFEAISMDTLKAAKELKEVGIDPYYFLLHISIDNAASGHSAIAIEIVCEYMEYVSRAEGEEAVQKAWKRLQAGYLLSSGLPGTTVCHSRRKPMDISRVPLSPAEMEVIRIFKSKAQVVHGIHCSSRVRIGSRSVADWLDPVALESKKWQKELLEALSRSKYWICRGDSSKSRFMKELQWNGRMFGSFTHDEYDVLKGWIDSMPNITLALNDPETKQNTDYGHKDEEEILSGYLVFKNSFSLDFSEASSSLRSTTNLFTFQNLPPFDIHNRLVVENFLPLWFSHPCLLQSFVSVPWRTKTKLACTIVKVLRAQGGFDIEQEFVAGMGEVRRPNSLGLPGVGIHMIAQHGLSLAELPSLRHVLQAWPSEFALYMLHMSIRPLEQKGILIGMATAFAMMHAKIVLSKFSLLSAQEQITLQKIAQRELEGLEVCWKELEGDVKVYTECCKGYLIAGYEIQKCFQF